MKEKRVLIVGAGCFGLSTAYHFLQSNQSTSEGAPGHPTYKVTVLDASTTIPAPDAASSDLNKIVRSSYSDKFYTQLAREAISLWKEGNICGNNTYHELVPLSCYSQPTLPTPQTDNVAQSLTPPNDRSGVLVLGLKGYVGVGPDETIYANLSLQNDIDAGANVKLFANPSDILAVLPEGAVAGSLFEAGGAYLNSDGGWASASEAMKALLDNVRHMGGEVIGGSKMTDLIFGEKPGDRVVGVMLEEGRAEYADVVVLAMGAWTPSILGNIEPIMNDTLTATG
jgi:sarcosine oxidase/L-pipecolate oxidase